MQDDESTSQDFEEIAYVLGVQQGAIVMPQVVPSMQSLFQQRAQDMSVPRIFYVLNLIGFHVFLSKVNANCFYQRDNIY